MTAMLNRPGAPDASSINRPLRLLLLEALAEHGAFMTSIELADAVELWPDQPRIRRQARVNAALRTMEGHGHVFISGVRLGKIYKKSYVWGITQRGIDELARPWPPPPTQTFLYLRELSARKAARAALRRDAESYIAQVRAGRVLGRDTPVSERRAIVADMIAHGATLAQVADVFGISREQVRVDKIKAEVEGEQTT